MLTKCGKLGTSTIKYNFPIPYNAKYDCLCFESEPGNVNFDDIPVIKYV